jgi:hypothetical protein
MAKALFPFRFHMSVRYLWGCLVNFWGFWRSCFMHCRQKLLSWRNRRGSWVNWQSENDETLVIVGCGNGSAYSQFDKLSLSTIVILLPFPKLTSLTVVFYDWKKKKKETESDYLNRRRVFVFDQISVRSSWRRFFNVHISRRSGNQSTLRMEAYGFGLQLRTVNWKRNHERLFLPGCSLEISSCHWNVQFTGAICILIFWWLNQTTQAFRLFWKPFIRYSAPTSQRWNAAPYPTRCLRKEVPTSFANFSSKYCQNPKHQVISGTNSLLLRNSW